MPKLWSDEAWADYEEWQERDPKTLKRINRLLKSISRGERIGKAEILKHVNPTAYSVRIDKENRLTYRVDGDTVIVLSCRGHYE